MPTILSHGVVAGALATAFPRSTISRRVIVAGVICSTLPDIDVLWMWSGAHYGTMLWHRGFTHSILFAAAVATIASFVVAPAIKRGLVWTYLFLAAVSHGLLDALTDRLGTGIPFFWPVDNSRYFLPTTPIAMSPIGTRFFSERGIHVLLSEMQWVWLPAVAFAVLALTFRRILDRSPNAR